MFFTPPRTIEAEAWTRMPAEFDRTARAMDNLWIVTNQGVPVGSFLEGPSFDRAGNLWVTDIPWGRIFRISPAGEWTLVAEYDGWPNGLKFHQDGRAFIADRKNGIMVLDPVSGKVESYLSSPKGERLKGPNDLFFAANGDLWFTDQGNTDLQDPTGRLYRVNAKDGTLDRILDRVPSPNGLLVSANGLYAYCAATRDNSVWRARLQPDGQPTKVGRFIALNGGGGPDGMAMDEQDGLLICHVGLGVVWVTNAHGVPTLCIKAPKGYHTTNIAFGGADRREVFITESYSGTILRARVDVPGRIMFSHM
ncbi:MAG: SMP-30/gluconolactonase/LRE family protein [Alphaproteobacteria bacterium]|nr:SMP-30/gluconolactonase/LRE family protein [Alphaproteobacteria bacterium]